MRLSRMLLALGFSLLLVTPAQATFTTFNENLPGGPNLTFATDIQIIANATQGIGWMSGAALTAQGTPDMTLNLTAGAHYNQANGLNAPLVRPITASSTVTIAAADANWPRIDLVSVPFNSGTAVVTTGVAYAAPVPPDIPSTSSVQNTALYMVIVPAGTTAITDALLIDKRLLIGSFPAVAASPDVAASAGYAVQGQFPFLLFQQQNGTLVVPEDSVPADSLGEIRYQGLASGVPATDTGVSVTTTTVSPWRSRYTVSSGDITLQPATDGSVSMDQGFLGLNVPLTTPIVNAASTGTTLNKLAKLVGAPSTAVIATTSDSAGQVVGIVVAGAGTSGSASIARGGIASCVFDGATTAGHYVTVSTTVTGDCRSFGASPPADGSTIIGRVLSTNGAGGTYSVLVQPAISSSPVSALALTSDATANSTTTGVEITGLNKTTGTGTFFSTHAIRYQSATSSVGVLFGVNHTGTVTTFTCQTRFGVTTGAAASQAIGAPVNFSGSATRVRSTTAPNLGPSTSVDTINADLLMVIECLMIVTVDGDLELWHASETATSTQVMAGSSLILTKTN